MAARSRSPIGNRVEKGGRTERQCVPSPLDDQKTIQPAETQNCPMEVPFVSREKPMTMMIHCQGLTEPRNLAEIVEVRS